MQPNEEMELIWEPEDLADGLKFLEQVQSVALKRLGEDPTSKETIRTYGLALSIEVAEFVNEMNWKSWKDKAPDLVKVADEFADVLHFIGTWLNILSAHGLDPDTLVNQFIHKQEVNRQRLNGEVEHYGAPDLKIVAPNGYTNAHGDTQLPFDLDMWLEPDGNA